MGKQKYNNCVVCGKPAITEIEEYCASCLRARGARQSDIIDLLDIQAQWDEWDILYSQAPQTH